MKLSQKVFIAGVALIACAFSGEAYVDSHDADIQRAKMWDRAFSVEPALVDDGLAPKVDSPDGTYMYYSPCPVPQWGVGGYDSTEHNKCEAQRKEQRLKAAGWIRTRLGQANHENYIQRTWRDFVTDFNKSGNNDASYLVGQMKQTLHDANQPLDSITNPNTMKEKFLVLLNDSLHGGLTVILSVMGCIFMLPLIWVMFWRLVGLAFRSAKEGVKG